MLLMMMRCSSTFDAAGCCRMLHDCLLAVVTIWFIYGIFLLVLTWSVFTLVHWCLMPGFSVTVLWYFCRNKDDKKWYDVSLWAASQDYCINDGIFSLIVSLSEIFSSCDMLHVGILCVCRPACEVMQITFTVLHWGQVHSSACLLRKTELSVSGVDALYT